jgi:hypothetical protein
MIRAIPFDTGGGAGGEPASRLPPRGEGGELKNSRERERESGERTRELPQRTQAVGRTISHACNECSTGRVHTRIFYSLSAFIWKQRLRLRRRNSNSPVRGAAARFPIRAAVGGVNCPGVRSKSTIFQPGAAFCSLHRQDQKLNGAH